MGTKSSAGAVLCLLLAGHFAFSAKTDELPTARPEDVGFSAERLNHIDQFFLKKVKEDRLAGIVVLVARHGKIAHLAAVGYADTGKQRKMEPDTIFRLYSMTKPIAATALMLLYEEGAFQLDDPISKYIPAFKGIRVLRTPESPVTDTVAAIREPTIHDLFRHTAGLKHGGDAYEKADLFGLNTSLEQMIERLAKLPLYFQPGTHFEYSVGQDVQARLVEILSGMPFERFLRERLFGPLGMKDTGYWVKDPSRLSALHWVKNGNVVPCDDKFGCPKAMDFLTDPRNINSYTVDMKHKGGSYGLAGTAEDYWRFAQMMLNGGEFNGTRFLSETTVHYMARDHLGAVSILGEHGEPTGTGWGLGFAVVKDAAEAATEIPDGSFYWAGAANTLFWIDPKNDLVVVAMTQSMDPKLEGWPVLREQISAMVYGALVR